MYSFWLLREDDPAFCWATTPLARQTAWRNTSTVTKAATHNLLLEFLKGRDSQDFLFNFL
jgi:hypothetical protein